MDYSIELKQIAKDNKVPVPTYVMADLVSIGYSPEDAYFIAFGLAHGSLNEQTNNGYRENLVNSNSFATLVLKRQKAHSIPTTQNILNEGELFSKERVAQEMLKSAMRLKPDDPNRVAALLKYADLMGMKKEEVKIEEEPTSYFLPLKCSKCPYIDFYNKFKRGEITYEGA